MTGRLKGITAVVTGGSSGIGAATVQLFLEEGANVINADLQAPPDGASDAIFRRTDVRREDEVAALIDFAVSEFGRLDVMFNNAGAGRLTGPIDTITLEDYDWHMSILQRGVFLGIKHAARVMKPRGAGAIINTASVAGLQTGSGGLLYSTAKAAVIHLTRCAAAELGESGIRVNCICPGGVATPIFARAFGLSQTDAERTTPIIREALSKTQPIQRCGEPIDIARAALWLASEESSFVNGASIVVDGGLTLGRSYSDSMTLYTGLAGAMGLKIL